MKLKSKLLYSICFVMFSIIFAGCGKGKSFEVSLNDGIASDVVMDGNELKSFTVKDAEGNDVSFICENTVVNDANQIVIQTGGCVFSATPLPKIQKINIKELTGASDESWLCADGGYGSNEAVITKSSDIVWALGNSVGAERHDNNLRIDCEPSYLKMTAEFDDVIFDKISVVYLPGEKLTGFSRCYLDEDFYGIYAENSLYDPGREQWNGDDILNFYLVMVPEGYDSNSGSKNWVFGTQAFKTGDLYDINNNIKSKEEALKKGDKIEVFAAGERLLVDLPIYEKRTNANLFEQSQYLQAPSTGELNVLVVPYYFKDQESDISDSKIEGIKKTLGRIIDENGNVTEYKPETNCFSLSEYFDIASYGNLTVNSFVTDWAEVSSARYADVKFEGFNEKYADQIQDFVKKNYSGMASVLDKDNNGYYDAVILVCAGDGDYDSFAPGTLSAAVTPKLSYGTERLGKAGSPNINYCVCINEHQLYRDNNPENKDYYANTMIHEFGHVLGLIDYYDVNYVVNAVGSYDMMSDNAGDWNPYSKFATGWIDPIIVSPEDIEKAGTVEVTINSFAKTGDTVLIPVKGTEIKDGKISPFEEYITVSLFTTDGVNKYDCERYGLGGITGVQIHHINGTSIERTLFDENSKKEYSLIYEAYTNAANDNGHYQVEVIQKSGINTFTDMNQSPTILCNDDFFYAGDSFSMEKHGAFFHNQRMDNGTDFPYEIKVKSINGDSAIIEISY
ncbi:MAG: hypothetical protein MJ107_04715 [Lachnospiraceae bacterium]|nr:hypothetical protein [Lachnospiraceae bacterium]